ncbi:MAG: phage integrase SAM-like domain-containing protein [Methylotenera sp.]|nr:phage integrase SAM-like domain-containing protein [Flavobacterium sp.]
MEQPSVFVSFFLDASRPNAEGKCLVTVNIYQKPHKRRYDTKFFLTKNEWSKLNSAKLRDEDLKELKKQLNALQTKAEKIIEEMVPFSFVAFEENFYNGSVGKKSRMLDDWFNDYIKKLKLNDQVSTGGIYQTSFNSIDGFKKNLQLQDITPTFLHAYEKHLAGQGKSTSTIGIYMRNIRTIINLAIAAGLISQDKYPFRNYEIPAGQNVKKALKDFDINHLLNYNPVLLDQKKALDFWILSYLCSGINFADIISLKPENINGNHLCFYRQKTKRTKKKDLRPIKVGLNPRAKEIIEIYKNTDPSNPYLFPVLEPGLSAVTIKNRCQRFIKWVNKRMLAISNELKIDSKITTYAARHTFSTVLKRKGAPISFIKDALGHASVATTENYLGSFEDEVTLENPVILTTLIRSKLTTLS